MPAPELTLVSHHLCPYVQRAAIALAEKAVPFQREIIDLNDPPAWFETVSPLGRVPVLLTGGEPLFESAAIVEYLEEVTARPLHPRDPVERARHRAWIGLGSEILQTIWTLETDPLQEGYEKARRRLSRQFAPLEGAISTGGPWFGGEAFSLVDAVFAPVFRYFEVFEAHGQGSYTADFPRLHAWRERLASRPSVRAAVGSDYEMRLIAFVKGHNSWLSTLLR